MPFYYISSRYKVEGRDLDLDLGTSGGILKFPAAASFSALRGEHNVHCAGRRSKTWKLLRDAA